MKEFLLINETSFFHSEISGRDEAKIFLGEHTMNKHGFLFLRGKRSREKGWVGVFMTCKQGPLGMNGWDWEFVKVFLFEKFYWEKEKKGKRKGGKDELLTYNNTQQMKHEDDDCTKAILFEQKFC